MIKIKITNAQEILEREKNWLFAKLAPLVTDIQTRVEEEVARQIKKSLQENNIEAVISVSDED